MITSSSLNYLMALTKSLQSEAKDIAQAFSEISSLISVFRDLRKNVDVYHDKWFSEGSHRFLAMSKEGISIPNCLRCQIKNSTFWSMFMFTSCIISIHKNGCS